MDNVKHINILRENKLINSTKNYRTMAFCLTVAAIYIIAFQLISQETIKSLISLLFVVFLLLIHSNNSFYLLMFIMCENELLSIGSTSVTMIFVSLLAIISIIRVNKNVKINVVIFFVSTALFCLSLLMVLKGSSEQLINTIKCFLFLIYISTILRDNRRNALVLYENAFRYIGLGINFCGIVSICLNGVPSILDRYTFHPDITINYLAIICALTIVNLMYIIIVIGSRYCFFDAVMIIGCSFWGLLTQSRSFILATCLGMVLIVLFSKSLKTKLKIVLTLLSVAILIMVIVPSSLTADGLLGKVINRILNPSGNDISNGRYYLWEQTIDAMNQNINYMLFGAGDYTKIGAIFDDKLMVAHNMFLETWVIYGWIGSILVLVIFYEFIKNNIFRYKVGRFHFVSLIPIITMLCALFYSHHFIGRSMSIVFIISFIPIAFTTTIKQRQRV